MGVVLKGFERSLNRYVAIKVLSPAMAASGAARKRFAREAQAAAAVLHENVIAIHRVDESHNLPYLVMPYVAGMSLQKRIDDEGPLPLPCVLRIGRQIAAGLAAAHAQGLVHRDIKPANILLERGVERVTITDFGLARAVDDGSVTKTGVIAGTPQFMSPEQSRGETIDARSDLFSLGSVMYAMCVGRPPFRADGIRRLATDRPGKAAADSRDQPGSPRVVRLAHRTAARQVARRSLSTGTRSGGVAGTVSRARAGTDSVAAAAVPARVRDRHCGGAQTAEDRSRSKYRGGLRGVGGTGRLEGRQPRVETQPAAPLSARKCRCERSFVGRVVAELARRLGRCAPRLRSRTYGI